MSSSICIFDLGRHPLPSPTSLRDFGVLMEALCDRPDGPNLKYTQLALRLERRFAAGGPAFWRVRPLDSAKALRRAAWQFELPPADAMAVLQALVDLAGELGLVVYDDQAGVGFLPDGTVIPAAAAQLPAPAPIQDEEVGGAEILDPSDACALLQPLLSKLLQPAGFVVSPSAERDCLEFQRGRGPLRQVVSLRVLRRMRLEGWLFVYHDAVSAAWRQVNGPNAHERLALRLELRFFHPGPEIGPDWPMERTGHAAAVVEVVRDKVVPFLDLCADLRGLDQVLNDPAMDDVRTAYKTANRVRPAGADGSLGLHELFGRGASSLLVARLDGNPRFAQMLAAMDAWHARGEEPRSQREDFERLRPAIVASQALAAWPDATAFDAARRPIPAGLFAPATHPREIRRHAWEATLPLQLQAHDQPDAFWQRFGQDDGQAQLRAHWDAIGETLPPAERVPAAGLSCERIRVAQPALDVLLLQFPPSDRLSEIQALALVRGVHGVQTYMVRNPHKLSAPADGLDLSRHDGHIRHGGRWQGDLGREQMLQHIARSYAPG